LPKLRRISSVLRTNSNNNNDQSTDSNSSGKSTDDNTVYVETLLYIVHVDDIDVPIPMNEKINEEMYDGGDEQQISSSNQIVRRFSKRTTASFNERHQLTKPSFTFSNPLRRLNSLLQTNVPSTSIQRQISNVENQNNNEKEDQTFPPPPLFINDIEQQEQQQLNIKATGSGLTDGFVEENCYFDLNAPNAELQKLVITIDGPSKADIQIEIIQTGIYRVYYNCQIPGDYHISLTYNGEHIHDSPYYLNLRARPPTATIEPIEFYVNIPCVVTVRPSISCSVFQASIQAPQGNVNLPITVHKSAKSECYEIYFVPNTSGNHYLNVHLNKIAISDNPCRLIVRPSSMKSISATGQGLFHAYTGESSHFFVSKSSNNSTTETGTFSVGISGPSTVFLDANPTEHGYEFHYKPTQSGKYLISIKNGGKHIEGSPFVCRVYNKFNETNQSFSTTYETTTQMSTSYHSLTTNQTIVQRNRSSTSEIDLDILRSSMTGDPSRVCVFGTGLYEAKPKRKATFKIDATQTGPGLLLVGLYSSLGPSERLVIKRIVSSPQLYKVSYRVRKRGQYMLVILYGSNLQHIPGSPFLVIVE